MAELPHYKDGEHQSPDSHYVTSVDRPETEWPCEDGEHRATDQSQPVELGISGGVVHLRESSLSDEVDPSVATENSANDDISDALSKRKQPLLELVDSEDGYVRRLRMIKDSYIPLVSPSRTPVTHSIEPTHSSSNLLNNVSSREAPSYVPPPVVPDDLAARWRILWGNWIQLCDWHSTFLEKLSSFVDTDPDKIPKLFIDSRSRLRSIYSKYCENHRKAALIAEQYRDYFDELRLYLNDKEDVVSYLMQPVQRIMRYQLPMAEIVKYTERARLPSLSMWKRALDIMKEIPKDTQLILEAARIDGFSGVITALGNILIRGDLLVASASRQQLLETVAGYKVALQEYANIVGYPSSKSQPKTQSHLSSPPDSASSTDQPTSTPSFSPLIGTNESVVVSEPGGLYTGSLKFVECRLFLFEQMLVVTEEVKPKRRVTTDTFAQSTYQFRAAINVNKMRYESHWYNCSLPNGHTNADAAAVDHLLSTGFAPDDLRFAVLDQTPGKDTVYVIDPITSANRQAWVVQLRDIQRMQQEFLLALQDPRRFNTGSRDDTLGTELDNADNHLAHPETHAPVVSIRNTPTSGSGQPQQQLQRQRKWPSFTVKRPGRLGSTSSPTSKETLPTGGKSAGRLANESANDRTANLARSLSAERRTFVRTKLDIGDSKFPGQTDSTAHGYRKSSLSASSSIKISNEIRFPDSPDASATETKSAGVGKKRNVFANLFGRNKSKHRAKPIQTPSHLPPTTTPDQDEIDPTSTTIPHLGDPPGHTGDNLSETTGSAPNVECGGE